MKTVEEIIRGLEGLRSLPPLNEHDINEAEKKLGLHFADDYRAYTKAFGAISANGIELTGVVSAPRLNVVNVTTSERELNQNLPAEMYVIENTGIDGVLALQNSKGEIFSISPNSTPEKKHNSLAEFLLSTAG